MQLDSVTAEIRPRSDWEAADLGLAMVRRDFWRCFSVWWLAVLLPTVGACWWLWDSPILCLLLFWWWKPAGSRLVLFELSRRLFGERPSWKTSIKRIPGAWCRRFFQRFVWLRFSPWLPVTMAVEDLEGLRGKAYRQRCGQVTRRGDSVVMWFYFIGDLASGWLGLALVLVIQMFLPEGQDGAWRLAVEMWNPDSPEEIPLLILRWVCGGVMFAMSLTDVFVTGVGFAVYINNRTAIEGWDVELAFKRLARRLTRATLVLLGVCLVWLPVMARAADRAEAPESAQVIREVKEHPDFKVHTVIDKVPKSPKSSGFWSWLHLGNLPAGFGNLVIVCVLALLIGGIAWLIWTNRHVLGIVRIGQDKPALPATARVVMGMEVSPESLPDDVPSAAWNLWRSGRHQEALGLLYRGTISRVMEVGRVDIQESDTEGDCQRRVDCAGTAAHPEYFRGLTRVWVGLAYAKDRPADEVVASLCREWPFVARREG